MPNPNSLSPTLHNHYKTLEKCTSLLVTVTRKTNINNIPNIKIVKKTYAYLNNIEIIIRKIA